MAMVIKNNAAAQAALGELKKNNDKLGKDLKKVASGMKINGAADDASAECIEPLEDGRRRHQLDRRFPEDDEGEGHQRGE